MVSFDGLMGSLRAEQERRTDRTRYGIEVAARLSLYLVFHRLLYYSDWFNITKTGLYIFVQYFVKSCLYLCMSNLLLFIFDCAK